MGRVYLAHDDLLDRHVAVKVIPSIDDHAVARFLVEARAAARIQHPNVATLYRVGQLDERPYLIYEYVRGTSLDHVPRPMEPTAVLDIAIDLARGLAAAHRRGVLHRDIKPGNAMLAEGGGAKLLDFGIAKLSGDAIPELVPQGRLTDEEEQQLKDLTGGQLLGTPYFMSPEAWRGQSTERSDLFSLGLVLYELLAGKGPFRDVPLHKLPAAVQSKDARPLRSVQPAVPEGLSAVVDRLLEREPERRFPSADDLLARLEALRPARAGARVPEGNPYRGLRPFEPEHRAVFFGRQRAIAQGLDRLRVERFLLVTGDSGVGKSSICAAGLLPLVGEGALEDGRTWQVARLVPGRAPVLALGAALAPVLGDAEDVLERAIREEPSSLPRIARKHLGEHDGLLLYVDQLEELVTIAAAPDAAAVSEAIGALGAGLPGIRVLATARSDFLSRLEALPGFAGRVSRALLLLAPLAADEVREAIVGPAAVKETRFASEAMIDRLVEAGTGAMPLLQFALAELWERRDGAVIPEAALEELGGVSGALSRHADALLAALLPAERVAARTLLLRLVTVERTRARRLDEELVGDSPHARPALDALVRGRLVVASDSPDGTTYEIAHEALVDRWDTLARWLAEEEDTRTLLHRIEAASGEWRRHGRRGDLLWSARQIAETAAVPGTSLTTRDKEFLAASAAAARRRRWMWRAAAVAAVLGAVAIWFVVKLQAQAERDAEIDRNVKEGESLAADARALDAELVAKRDAVYPLFNTTKKDDAEAAWAEVLAIRERVLTRYRDASEKIEGAVLLGGGRRDLRRHYGELLFERAVVAERERLTDQYEELIRRLHLYDEHDALAGRLHGPAHLTVITDPPGAQVMLRRYNDDFVLDAGTPLGTTPIRGVEVRPGSLVLELRAPDRPAVVAPVLLARNEDFTVDVPIPASVPDGYIYVPPGRTVFGSKDPESVRAFFFGIPMHATTTDAYLIGRHEVTFGEWIEFLEALPDDERAAHTPGIASSGAGGGALSLTRDATGWRLAMTPVTTVLTPAAAGQPVRYPDRDRRVEQDWLKLPVIAVSYNDVLAYTSWLARSGRVPGARPCTELEWERAARGADDRPYPGGRRLGPDDANIDVTYGMKATGWGPDEVGSHPASRSPFGVDDLAGNVWEWVHTETEDYGSGARGGSFYSHDTTCAIANRERPAPSFRDVTVGARVCATVLVPSQ
jgi:formylglycine-generating enzyme required for sulfatase activity